MLKPVLIDSSVWIDYFNGVSNAPTEIVNTMISEHRTLCICPPINQEVLQGFRHDTDYNTAVRLFRTLEHLKAEPYKAARGAAQLFRRLRKQGITVRKSNDCLIAWYAVAGGCTILHRDRDYDIMSKPLKLRVVQW